MSTTLRTFGSAEEQLDRSREAAHVELLASRTRTLADMSEAEFNSAIEKAKLIQSRMRRIMKEVLVVDVHYGREKDKQGNDVFKKDRLKKAGVEEIRRIMRCTCRSIEAPIIQESQDDVSVIVSRGAFDAYGTLLATANGACHSKETRFRKFSGKGWIYDDPREQLHNMIAMANKRCDGFLVSEVSGATGWFADGEAFEQSAEESDETPFEPWTKHEKELVGEAAKKKGMSREAFAVLMVDTLGRMKVGTGEDVDRLLEAVAKWVHPRDRQPAPADPAPDAPTPSPAPAPSASTPPAVATTAADAPAPPTASADTSAAPATPPDLHAPLVPADLAKPPAAFADEDDDDDLPF